MKEFEGKVAVITGAGRGLGRGIAFQCAKKGMKVVLAGIREESLLKTASDLQKLGTNTHIIQTDVSIQEDVERLAKESYSKFGSIHLLVNNAGVSVQATALKSSLSDWNWLMGVNFYGVLYGVHAFVPRMIEQNSDSHIINVSSLMGVVEAPAPYAVAKHAVVALSEALYHELADTADNVKVSVYCPGAINSEFYRIDDSRSDRFKSDATSDSDQAREGRRQFFEKYGFSVEEAVNVLFSGIENDQLYIGPLAYQKQFPNILNAIQSRADNIVNEQNPAHPWSVGPVTQA